MFNKKSENFIWENEWEEIARVGSKGKQNKFFFLFKVYWTLQFMAITN